MILNPEMKCWDVQFTRSYTSTVNGSVIVVAESARKVCELVAEVFPTATIYQINHRGKGVILDAGVLQNERAAG